MRTVRTAGRGRWLLAVVILALLVLLLLAGGPRAAFADSEADTLQILDDAAENGTVGVYLRQIGGSTIAATNESFVFEPASTIKALIHFHAMRQAQDNAFINGDFVTLGRQIPVFLGPANYANSPGPGQTSCPDNSTLPSSDTLQNGLVQMMGPSDNRWTQAFRDFFGDANINATRATLGMNDTALNHMIGCGGPVPNQLTLVDAGLLYEGVATGFLDDANRATAYSLMTQDNGAFNAIIDAEAAGMGLDSSSINSFKAQRQSANKAGSYGVGGQQYRSVAGSSQIPWKDGVTCETEIREYVYGAFIHAADSLDASFIGIRSAGVEVFRDTLRDALESWEACEADLEITSTIVVDPPAEIDVNTPVSLTVRVAMRNNGPADFMGAVLSRTTSVASDCVVNPTDSETAVPAMPQGVLVVQEMDFTIECSNPSSHGFGFGSSIAPAVAEVVEPDLTNNSGNAAAAIAVIARAEVAVTGWDFSELDNAQIQDLLVGEDFLFPTMKTIHNFGDTVGNLYPDPIDVDVTRSIEVPEGVRAFAQTGVDEGTSTITIQRPGDPDQVLNNQPPGTLVLADGPATIIVEFDTSDLAVGETREIEETFGVRCMAPGEHELNFINSVTPQDEHVEDPDESNNSLEVSKTIECITPVQINIRPGNSHNFINPGGNGSVPVAVLTTEAGEYGLPLAFDATTIDRASVLFGTTDTLNDGAGSAASPDVDFVRDAHEMDDKTKDGDDDRVLLFGIPGSGADDATVEMCVVGQYVGDDDNVYTFFGCDTVAIQP